MSDEPVKPRAVSVDLALVERRIAERRAAASRVDGVHRATIESDTDMLRALVRDVRCLRLANAALKDVIDAMQRYRRPR